VQKGFRHCCECPDLPCKQLLDFSKDGLPHHGEVVENIHRQRNIGFDSWAEEQRLRWRCPKCGGDVDWYAGQCYECAAMLTPQFSTPKVPGADTPTSP
jgi:hypothetical protein